LKTEQYSHLITVSSALGLDAVRRLPVIDLFGLDALLVGSLNRGRAKSCSLVAMHVNASKRLKQRGLLASLPNPILSSGSEALQKSSLKHSNILLTDKACSPAVMHCNG
jgi:hypothetical protein